MGSEKKKCLYLTLTDGSQQVFGLELTPISCFSHQLLKPGVKLLLTGPIECRRGVLQLRPANVKVLGGEVESFKVSNSMESIIARRLNIPNDQTNNARQQQSQRPRTTTTPTPTAATSYPPPTSTTTRIEQDGEFPDDDEDDLLLMEIDENLLH